MIELKNISKQYRLKSGIVNALDCINLELPEKGLVFVLGKSGCGKSTLLNVLGGIDAPTGGDIIVDGKRIANLSAKDLDKYRRDKVGFIFQDYNLIHEYKVSGNLSIALELIGEGDVKNKINNALTKVDLAGYEDRKISQLSGGQKQRVAIARAIIKNPSIILADEPTGNLDSKTAIGIMELLRSIAEENLVVVVTHDSNCVEKYGDRIIELVDGNIVRDTINIPQATIVSEELTETVLASIEHPSNSESLSSDNLTTSKVVRKARKKKRIALSKLFKISFVNIWKKKMRLIVTMLLFVFSLTLCGIGFSAWAFDIDKVTYSTYRSEKYEDLNILKKRPDLDYVPFRDFFTPNEVEALKNRNDKFEFNSVYCHKDGRCFEGFNKDNRLGIYAPKSAMLINENILSQRGHGLLVGTIPTKVNEFCIPKLLADKLIEYNEFGKSFTYEKIIGKEIEFTQYGKMTIVGIVDTNIQPTIDIILKSKLADNDKERKITETIEFTSSNSILVCEEFVNYKLYDIERNSGYVEFSKYFNFGFDSKYELTAGLCSEKYSDRYIGDAYDTIVYAQGTTSLGNNEIIIDKYTFQILAENHFQRQNLTDADFIEFLNTKPVINDFAINNEPYMDLTIAGYYCFTTSEPPHLRSQIIIVDDNFIKRETREIGIISLQSKLSGNDYQNKALINDLSDSNLELISYFSYELQDSAHNANVFKILGMGIAAAFSIFSIVMMFSFITASIKTNKKQIGILRSIGMSSSKVSIIFLIESLLLCLISFALATIVIFPVALALCHLTTTVMVFIQTFVIDILVLSAMLGLSLSIGVIGSLVPVLVKTKENPINLLKD